MGKEKKKLSSKNTGTPVFNRNKRYVNAQGQKFGQGVWEGYGGVIFPGWGDYDRKKGTVTQYNSDGTISTYPLKGWHNKKTKDHETKILQNDRRWAIPYIPEKKVTVSIDKDSPTNRNQGISFSENVLDSIAVNAKRAGVPFSTGLDMAALESHAGSVKERTVGRSFLPWLRVLNQGNDTYKQKAGEVSYEGYYSPSLLISNWKQRSDQPFSMFEYNGKGTLLNTPLDDRTYENEFRPALWKSNDFVFNDISPLQHGFENYRENPNKYNPNDPTYSQKVEANKDELINYSPEIKAYMKKHNLHDNGGSLNNAWDSLSLGEKDEMMKVAIANGITTLPEIREAYNTFAKGGYKPSQSIKKQIANWEGSSMRTNRSFEAEAKDFNNVIPSEVRNKLSGNQLDALYSYGYNAGMGNLKKRVVPTLTDYVNGKATKEDVQRSMWASRDNELRGLTRRRNWERGMFGGNYRSQYTGTGKIGVELNPASYGLSSRFFEDIDSQINLPQIQFPETMSVDPETLYKAPVIEDTQEISSLTPEEVIDNSKQERLEGLKTFNTVMELFGRSPLVETNSNGNMGLLSYIGQIYK